MDIAISSINSCGNNTKFGMAEFTPKGYMLAKQHADIYESLAEQNNYQNPEFFKKTGLFSRAPFTKYYISKITNKNEVEEIANTIIACGATDNSHTNAQFISQLLKTEKYIHKTDDNDRDIISNAINEVFKKNWDNPELSKKDTFRLLEMAKYAITDKAYVSLNGVILTCDAK